MYGIYLFNPNRIFYRILEILVCSRFWAWILCCIQKRCLGQRTYPSYVFTNSEFSICNSFFERKILLDRTITIILAFFSLFRFFVDTPFITDQSKQQILWGKIRFHRFRICENIWWTRNRNGQFSQKIWSARHHGWFYIS